MRGSPFVVAGIRNSLLVVGCGGSTDLRDGHDEIVAGCSTLCTNATASLESGNSSCYGTGCCQNSIPNSIDYFSLELQATSVGNSSSGDVGAGVIDASFLANTSDDFSIADFRSGEFFPTLLLWTVPDLPTGASDYSNSGCQWDASLKGYTCRCRYEYSSGNPYLPNGCQVFKECEQCPGSCASVVVGNTTAYRCPPTPTLELKESAVSSKIALVISLICHLFLLYKILNLENICLEIFSNSII